MEKGQLTAEAITSAVDYLNGEQPKNVLNIARMLAGQEWASSAVITDMDASGFNLAVSADERSDNVRVDFGKTVDSERGLRMTLMGLAMKADPPDGVDRIATAQVETEKASRYLRALCNHFDHEGNAGYEIGDDGLGHGHVNFDFGVCTMEANASTLTMQVKAVSPLRFDRMKGVVGSHLVRFAQKEELQVTWVDA
ncbi:MAG: DUF2218 domain-containing protein [Chloroflexota bacterium]